jgi:hypothetical protein
MTQLVRIFRRTSVFPPVVLYETIETHASCATLKLIWLKFLENVNY